MININANIGWTICSGGGAQASSLLNGLIHAWHLDEAGTTTSDLRLDSVGGIHLTPSATLMTQAAGKSGLAYTNNGQSRYLFADSQEMRDIVDSSFTFSCWLRLTSLSNSAAILNCWNAYGVDDRSYALNFQPNVGLRWILSTDGIDQINPIIVLPDAGVWYHAVFGWDHVNGLSFLIVNNGSPEVLPVASIHKTSHAFRIGVLATTVSPDNPLLDGQVDEVLCWNRLLTSEEIAELYNAGAGKFYPFSN